MHRFGHIPHMCVYTNYYYYYYYRLHPARGTYGTGSHEFARLQQSQCYFPGVIACLLRSRCYLPVNILTSILLLLLYISIVLIISFVSVLAVIINFLFQIKKLRRLWRTTKS
jgi:hypothetical protein